MDKYVIHNFLGIQGFHIAWYGMLTVTGIICGIILAIYRIKKRNLSEELLLDALLGILPLSFIGARLYYVAFHWDEYSGNFMKILAIRDGGQAMYGSIIGGILGAMIVCRIIKFPFLQLADLIFPSVLVGQIIGRWGNFINQEAFGRLITNPDLQFFPYGVYIEALGEWHQATFFYECIWNVGVLLFILLLEKKWPQDGCTLAVYFIGYGIGRFFIEGLRMDSLYLTGTIRVSQLLSAVLVMFGVFLFIRQRKTAGKEGIIWKRN